MIDIKKIRQLVLEQYKKFNESRKCLMDMLLTEDAQDNWEENYHLIDHDWIVKWKDYVSFDDLEKKSSREIVDVCQYIDFDSKKIDELKVLNNKSIYYGRENNDIVDPLKTFDIISHEVWKLFDELKNENANYNGKVSLLKGNRKIIIRLDQNNYYVKYLANNNEILFGEFIIIFGSDKKDINNNKNNILKHLSKANIYDWMKEIDFQSNLREFKVEKYSVPFEIKQKTNNNYISDVSFDVSQDCYNEAKQYVSFSKASFSFNFNSVYNNNGTSGFFSSDEFSTLYTDIDNYRIIEKYEQTSNIIAVMRCLSMIEPLTTYFTCCTKKNRVFEKFQSFSLINLIGDFFSGVWNNENTSYDPKNFIKYIRNKTDINIYEEQDPFIFLNYILEYINSKLNKIDKLLSLNFSNVIKKYKEKTYYDELIKKIEKKNSIVGKYFLGLILEKYKCNNKDCSIITTKIKPFNIIDIDYLDILDYLRKEGISFSELDIEFLLQWYFLEKKLDNIKYPSINCSKCSKEATIETKKLLFYPEYLIIRLNIHKFHQVKQSMNDSFILKLNNNYDKIDNMNIYFEDEIKNNNIKYDLISMINYTYNEKNSLRFLSICKSVINTINYWISFYSNAKPEKLKGDYKNSVSQPYILFYQLEKNE